MARDQTKYNSVGSRSYNGSFVSEARIEMVDVGSLEGWEHREGMQKYKLRGPQAAWILVDFQVLSKTLVSRCVNAKKHGGGGGDCTRMHERLQ